MTRINTNGVSYEKPELYALKNLFGVLSGEKPRGRRALRLLKQPRISSQVGRFLALRHAAFIAKTPIRARLLGGARGLAYDTPHHR